MKGKPKIEWIKKKLRKGNLTYLREEITTEAPLRPSLLAMAKPIPCVEVVTIPTFSSNLFDFTISTFDGIQAKTYSLTPLDSLKLKIKRENDAVETQIWAKRKLKSRKSFVDKRNQLEFF